MMFFNRAKEKEGKVALEQHAPETVTVFREKRTGHIIGSKYNASAPVSDQWNRAGDCSKCRKEAYCSKECRAAKDKRLLMERIRTAEAKGRAGISGAGELPEKTGILKLEPGAAFDVSYTILVPED